MVLSDGDIKKRIIPLDQTGLPENFLDLLKVGEVPKELNKLLNEGHIIINPPPKEEYFDGDTFDLRFGHIVEMPEIPLEICSINGKTTIRRFTTDFRDDSSRKRLDNLRKVSIEDQSRLRFVLDNNETLELQPGMMVLAHTLEMICVPYDLQMQIWGRSRIARCYVCAHISSPIFHPGWCGHLTMEVKNDGHFSFNVFPGLVFAAVTFNQLSSKAERPYLKKPDAKYSGQR